MGFVNPGRSSTRLNRTFGKRYNNRPPSPPPQKLRKTRSSCSSSSYSIQSSATSSPNHSNPQTPLSTASPPPPLTRNSPTLRTLPPELLQRIFLFSKNPQFPATTLHLTRALSAPILKHEYIRIHHGSHIPTELLHCHFFTAQFLRNHESRYQSTLKFAPDTFLPPHRYSVEVLRLLLSRGATLSAEDSDEWTAVLREGIQEADLEFIRAVLDEAGANPDQECLGLAIEMGWVEGMEVLVEKGGVGLCGRGVWEKALEAGENGRGAGLGLLLERGCPPAGLLGRVGEVVSGLKP